MSENDKDQALILYEELKHEWESSDEEKLVLIRSEGIMSRADIAKITETCKRYGLPLAGVNIISSKAGKNIYINSEGIRWKLHLDSRGLKGSCGEIVHYPTKEEPWITARGTVEMHDGAIATNEAIIDWDWERVTGDGKGGTRSRQDANFTFGNLCMKLITKAKRRAGVELVGVGLPIYDEWLEHKDGVVEASFEIIKPLDKSKAPTNVGELMSLAWEVYQLGTDELILRAVDKDGNAVENLGSCDVGATWDKLSRKE